MTSFSVQRTHGPSGLSLTPSSATSPTLPHLIFLHGFTQTSLTWMGQISRLDLRQDYAITLLDLPGHGGYGVRVPGPMEYFASIASLTPQAHLVGYSMGGRLLAWYGSLYPQHVSSMTLISTQPGFELSDEREERLRSDTDLGQQIKNMDSASYHKFLTSWNAQPIFGDRALDPSELRNRESNIPRGIGRSLIEYSPARQPSLWPYLCQSFSPIQVLTGSKDTKYSAIGSRLVAESGGAISWEEIPSAHHDPLSSHPQVVMGLISRFLPDRPTDRRP